MPSKLIHFDYQPLAPSRIDLKKGIVYGVTVITCGVQAKGHDLVTDPVTLEQILESAQEKGDRIPTKLDHKTGINAVNGALVNFRIKGKKLLADWELLLEHPTIAHTLELCQKMSDIIGLSASFTGEGEITSHGKAARCKELISVDLVAHPAANPGGLFEANHEDMVDIEKSGMAKTIKKAPETTEEMLAAILEGQVELAGRMTAIEEFNAEVAERIEAEDAAEGAEGEYTPEEIAEAQAILDQEEAAARGGNREGDDEPDERDEQLAALNERLTELEAERAQARAHGEQQVWVTRFAALEERMVLLAAQRDEALAELENYRNPQVQSSTEGQRMFSSNATGGTDWQQLVQQHVAENANTKLTDKQKYLEAVQFCIKNHAGEYETHLATLERGETNLSRQ